MAKKGGGAPAPKVNQNRQIAIDRNRGRRLEKDKRLKLAARAKWQDKDRTPKGTARAARRFGMGRKQHSLAEA